MSPDERDADMPGIRELRRVYRDAGLDDEPSAELDASIRAAARRAVHRRRQHQYLPPLALAATIVVAVGLVLRLTALGPERIEPSPRDEAAPGASAPASPSDSAAEALSSDSAPTATRMVAPATEPAMENVVTREAPAAQRAAAPQQAPAAEGAASFGATARARVTVEVCSAPRPLPADAWLTCIAEAADAGSIDAARADLDAFEGEYPDYPVPDALAERLGP